MDAPSRAQEPVDLLRALGLSDAVLLVVGTVIGSGVFLVSADIARAVHGGGALLAVWIVGGFFSLLGAMSLAELGEFAEAERFAAEAAALTPTGDLPFGYALARMCLGQAEIVRGRPDAALRALDEALDVMERRGLPTWHPWGVAVRGYALALSGRVAEGTAGLERGIERAAALPYFFGHAQWIAWLGHAHLLAGRLDEARGRAEEALSLARRVGTRGGEAWALHVLAEAAARRGDRDATRDLVRRARASPRSWACGPSSSAAARRAEIRRPPPAPARGPG